MCQYLGRCRLATHHRLLSFHFYIVVHLWAIYIPLNAAFIQYTLIFVRISVFKRNIFILQCFKPFRFWFFDFGGRFINFWVIGFLHYFANIWRFLNFFWWIGNKGCYFLLLARFVNFWWLIYFHSANFLFKLQNQYF
jgi:hypothetical protein